MMFSWNEALAFTLAIPLSFGAVQMGAVAYKWLRGYAIVRCIRRISSMIVAEEEPSDRDIRLLRRAFPMGVMLDAVIFVAEKIYGDAFNRLALIVEECELDYRLLCAIRRRGGDARAHHLSQLSSLNYATMFAESVDTYLEEQPRSSRFYAMVALISARPSRAISYISQFDETLNLHEVAVIAQLMRRAGVAIAYTPLLLSPNQNLQLVGIYLCGHFSITDAEPHLQRLVESDNREVAYFALQTLCSIRGDISTPQVARALQRLLPYQRNAFILSAVQNCYSLRSCAHLLTRAERTIFSRRTDSYKCRIVCN